MRIGKKEMIEKLASFVEVGTKTEAKRIIDCYEKLIIELLGDGEIDEISETGFLKYSVVPVPEREHRNPTNGETVLTPAHNRLVVKPSKTLKDIVRK